MEHYDVAVTLQPVKTGVEYRESYERTYDISTYKRICNYGFTRNNGRRYGAYRFCTVQSWCFLHLRTERNYFDTVDADGNKVPVH